MSYETRLIIGRLNPQEQIGSAIYLSTLCDIRLSNTPVFNNTYVDERDKGPRAYFVDDADKVHLFDSYGAELYGNPPAKVWSALAMQRKHPIAFAAKCFLNSLMGSQMDKTNLAVIIYGY